jgi:hypothetical protein
MSSPRRIAGKRGGNDFVAQEEVGLAAANQRACETPQLKSLDGRLAAQQACFRTSR